MKNYGVNNEIDFVNFIDDQIKSGIRNFVFKGENGITKIYKNIIKVTHVERPTFRSKGMCNKGDVLIYSNKRNSYPLSIKMSNVKTSWESADSSLKHILKDYIMKNGRVDIKGKYVIVKDHDVDLKCYVFGDDIIARDGCIIVQTVKDSTYSTINNICIMKCDRIFVNYIDVKSDKDYLPVVTIRKNRNRNINDPLIYGYRIEVNPYHVAKD